MRINRNTHQTDKKAQESAVMIFTHPPPKHFARQIEMQSMNNCRDCHKLYRPSQNQTHRMNARLAHFENFSNKKKAMANQKILRKLKTRSKDLEEKEKQQSKKKNLKKDLKKNC